MKDIKPNSNILEFYSKVSNNHKNVYYFKENNNMSENFKEIKLDKNKGLMSNQDRNKGFN